MMKRMNKRGEGSMTTFLVAIALALLLIVGVSYFFIRSSERVGEIKDQLDPGQLATAVSGCDLAIDIGTASFCSQFRTIGSDIYANCEYSEIVSALRADGAEWDITCDEDSVESAIERKCGDLGTSDQEKARFVYDGDKEMTCAELLTGVSYSYYWQEGDPGTDPCSSGGEKVADSECISSGLAKTGDFCCKEQV